MSRSVVEVLLIATFIVFPLFAWVMLHFLPNRVANWRKHARALVLGTLLGVPLVFLLYKMRGYTVQQTWDFVIPYVSGFFYFDAIFLLWISLFKRFFRPNSGESIG